MARRTFLELQNEVLAHGFNDTRYRDRIAQWINDGFMRAARKIKASGFLGEDSFVTVAGTQRYDLPADFVRLESVRLTDTDPDEALRHLELSEAQVSGDYRARPTHYSVVGSQLSLWPLPDSNTPVTITYWTTAAELAPRELADGEVNLVTNPRAGAGTTAGWVNGGLTTFGAVTLGGALSPPVEPEITTVFHGVGDASADRANFQLSVVNGVIYHFSMYVYLISNTATGVRLRIDNAANVAKAQTADLAVTGAWTRLDVSVTADATETWNFFIRQNGAGVADFYWTAALIEKSASLGGYFDGDFEGYEWSGAPHASTSQLSVSSLSGTPAIPEEYDQVAISYALWMAYTSEHDPEMANYHKNEYRENLMDLGIDLQNPDAHANRQVGGMIEYFKGLT